MVMRLWMIGGNVGNRLLWRSQPRMCSSMCVGGESPEYPLRSVERDPNPKLEKRLSRRRYSAANTKGRSKHVYSIIASLKSCTKMEMTQLFDKLHPRDKLDVLRALRRRSVRRATGLPTYISNIFERRYFFKESDISEQSTLGRGPGGQATNRRMQTAIVKHEPTGIIVKFSKFPSYWLNRRAAREILNLRLEEHLLGPKSRLARTKQREERKQLHRNKIREKMVEKGNIETAKMSQQRRFHAVLTSALPFPPVVLLQLGSSFRSKNLFMSDLFEGECNRWWPMLLTAFGQLNGEASLQDGCDNNTLDNIKVPELFFYAFPAVFFHSPSPLTSVENFEWNEVKKCAEDETALRNVFRGLSCFVELFGLHLQEKHLSKADNTKTDLVLAKDGLNWVEFRGRMMLSNERMTPLAYACFSHVVLSLTQLGCAREANAILTFFHREAKAGLKCQWAMHGWKRMCHVLECHDSPHHEK